MKPPPNSRHAHGRQRTRPGVGGVPPTLDRQPSPSHTYALPLLPEGVNPTAAKFTPAQRWSAINLRARFSDFSSFHYLFVVPLSPLFFDSSYSKSGIVLARGLPIPSCRRAGSRCDLDRGLRSLDDRITSRDIH